MWSFFRYCDSEPQREYILFERVDKNLDGNVDKQEFNGIFLAFDVNHDGNVTESEFRDDWVNLYKIGAPNEADALYLRADTNDDGMITLADMPQAFGYFDLNNDGNVDMNEFLTQWGDLKLIPSKVDIIDSNSPSTTTKAPH
ncbi:hypothetical protein FSP39_009551 [Pinctada imbricata]|uniref:EF-hand domain-containing protein n=1 Tax=Pinctada imbricata TaxID=66713 RepID=A0AA89BQV2_PINIB|nr:hypothetical protein FSP39_009551 [Pinctada imbricata]